MQSCIVHIGLTKAASSTLQEFFKRHPSVHLVDMWHTCNLFVPRNGLLYDAAGTADYFLREVESAHQAGKIGIVSHERLAGSPHSGHYDVVTIAHRIHDIFPQAKVVICIREQMRMLASCYKQYIRAGGSATLKEYLLPLWDHRVPRFEWKFYCYFDFLNYYFKLFGQQNVLVVLVEELEQNPARFFHSLTEFMELGWDDSLTVSEVINKGIPDTEINRQRCENFFADLPFSVKDHNIFSSRPWLNRMLKWLGTNLLGDEEINAVEATRALFAGHFAEDNRRTGELISKDLGTLGYEV